MHFSSLTGFAGGQHYTHTGGASNYQCLPLEPEYNSYLAGDQGNYIYGAEYETGSYLFGRNMQNQNVPCASCFTPQRTATIMIPAKRSCPDETWTKVGIDGCCTSPIHRVLSAIFWSRLLFVAEKHQALPAYKHVRVLIHSFITDNLLNREPKGCG